MNGNVLTGLVGIIFGLLCALGAWLRWPLIMNPNKLLPRLFGEEAARMVYLILGVALVLMGLLFTFGVIGGQS